MLRLCGGRLVFLMLFGLLSVLQYSLPLSISQRPWFLSQSALKIAAGLGMGFQTNFTSNTHCDGGVHKLMEQNYNFIFIHIFLQITTSSKSINSATCSSDGCFELKRRVGLTDHFNKMTLLLHICTC